ARLVWPRGCGGPEGGGAIANVATRRESGSQCEREIRAEPIAAPPATESRIPVGRVNPEFGALAVIGMPQFAEIAYRPILRYDRSAAGLAGAQIKGRKEPCE